MTTFRYGRFGFIALTAIAASGAFLLQPGRSAPSAPLPYKCIALGTLGGSWSTSFGVNDFGEVVGDSSQVPNNTVRNFNLEERAFYWKDNNGNNTSDPGEMVFLGSLGYNSTAYAISNGGEAVGVSSADGVSPRAVLWNVRSNPRTMTNLNTLLTASDQAAWILTSARDINENRQVTGQARRLSDGAVRGFVFDLNSGQLTTVDPAPLVGSNAKSLNNLAPPQAVGYLTGTTGPSYGFFHDGIVTNNLTPTVSANGINDAGGIACKVNIRPAYWKDANGNGVIDGAELVDLGTFGLEPPTGFGKAEEGSAINNSGLLVGSATGARAEKGGTPVRAMRWQVGTPASAKQDLNSLTSAPFPLRRALHVSDSGYVVGWGNSTYVHGLPAPKDQAYVLKPN